MIVEKKLGIWMDHSSAHLTEFATEPMETKTISSKFTHDEKEQSLNKSENLMHNKEQHQQAGYYKEIGETVKNYSSVLLFGPTSAKEELYNILRSDHKFKKIKLETKSADKMTEHQQQLFIREHFSKT